LAEKEALLVIPMIDAEGTILANRDGLKVAVIVNDISEVNVDAQLMKNGSTSLSRVDERLVEMQNG